MATRHAAYVTVCIRGYTRQVHQQGLVRPCTLSIDGMRTRECSLTYYMPTGKGVFWTETFYFIDRIPCLPPLDEQKDVLWFVHRNLSGLPLNPTLDSYPLGSLVFYSDQILDVVIGRLHEFRRVLPRDAGPVLVLTPRPLERKWLVTHLASSCAYGRLDWEFLDLYWLGARPTGEQLALHYFDLVNCGCHHKVRQRTEMVSHVTNQALHCAQLQSRLYLRWWLDMGYALHQLPEALKPIFPLVRDYVRGCMPRIYRPEVHTRRRPRRNRKKPME